MPTLKAPTPTARNRQECLEYAMYLVAAAIRRSGKLSHGIETKVGARVVASRDPVIADANPGCPIDTTCGRDVELVANSSDLAKMLKDLGKYLAALRRTYPER